MFRNRLRFVAYDTCDGAPRILRDRFLVVFRSRVREIEQQICAACRLPNLQRKSLKTRKHSMSPDW